MLSLSMNPWEKSRFILLEGADHGYRVLVESITEGALILSSDDSIYYCNRTLGEMLGLPIQKIISKKLDSYIASEGRCAIDGTHQGEPQFWGGQGRVPDETG